MHTENDTVIILKTHECHIHIYSTEIQTAKQTFNFEDDVWIGWRVQEVILHKITHLIVEKSTNTRVQKFLLIAYIYADSFQILASKQFREINKSWSIVISEIIHVAYNT